MPDEKNHYRLPLSLIWQRLLDSESPLSSVLEDTCAAKKEGRVVRDKKFTPRAGLNIEKKKERPEW